MIGMLSAALRGDDASDDVASGGVVLLRRRAAAGAAVLMSCCRSGIFRGVALSAGHALRHEALAAAVLFAHELEAVGVSARLS